MASIKIADPPGLFSAVLVGFLLQNLELAS